ncbi:UNVERIFIED_CONTAM: hypothetical protein NCL1_53094 [Trichonephila clavipes]
MDLGRQHRGRGAQGPGAGADHLLPGRRADPAAAHRLRPDGILRHPGAQRVPQGLRSAGALGHRRHRQLARFRHRRRADHRAAVPEGLLQRSRSGGDRHQLLHRLDRLQPADHQFHEARPPVRALLPHRDPRGSPGGHLAAALGPGPGRASCQRQPVAAADGAHRRAQRGRHLARPAATGDGHRHPVAGHRRVHSDLQLAVLPAGAAARSPATAGSGQGRAGPAGGLRRHHRGKQLDAQLRVLADPVRQARPQLRFQALQVTRQVFVGGIEGVVLEDRPQRLVQRPVGPVATGLRGARAAAQRWPRGVDEHAAIADQVMAEQAAEDRVEPGLRQLVVETQVDQRDIGALHQRPLAGLQQRGIEALLQTLAGLRHLVLVEVDARGRGLLRLLPQRLLEAGTRAIGDLAELLAIIVEAIEDQAGDPVGRPLLPHAHTLSMR